MQKVQGFVENGNLVITVGGVSAAQKAQGSYPQAQVAVYLAGTTTLASIFADNLATPTPKANPFTAQTNGYFFFYAANGRYDVTFSGGGLAAPLTFGDILLADPAAGPTTVTSVTAGTGISVAPNTGAVVVTNAGVVSVTGGPGISVAPPAGTGNVTLTNPWGALPSGQQLDLLHIQGNTGNNTTLQWTSRQPKYSPDYNFPPQSPGGSLVVGQNVITLTPVPLGVNGTDRFHYLYISGGTGTAEGVLITGGTAVAGATTGTVIVSCANTHTGAWTIQSASTGIKEASCAQNETGTVRMPTGTLTLRASLVLPTTLSLEGMGAYATFIQAVAAADPAIVIANYDKGEGTGWFGEHRDYQLMGSESGQGFYIGGGVLGISSTWQGDQVRVTNCYFNRFNQTLVIRSGNFCVFTRCMFAPLSSGLGTTIYIPAGGGSLQPMEFYACVLTGQNIAVQMDNSNYGAAYLLYMGGQVSGVVMGNELCWESHGTHFEPNVHGQLIINVTTSSVIKIFGGLLSVHLDTLMAAAINVTGANSTFTIEGTYVIVDGGQIVTNFVNFGGGAGGKFRMQGINVAPAGGFTNMYAFPSGVPNICSIDLGIVSVTVTAAATLVFPQGSTTARSVVTIQGATIGGSGITAVSGLILGQYGLITCLQTQTFTSGASIGNTITLNPNVPYTYYFSGTQIWIR
jgi:hypothetical protein